jgi:hypothetical protein
MYELIREDQRLTVREIPDELNNSSGTSSHTDSLSWNETQFDKTCSSASEQDQIEQRATACRELLQSVENDATFLPGIITEDETWVYGYDPETKQMSSQ